MGKHKFNSGRICEFCGGFAESLPRGEDGKFLQCPEASEEGAKRNGSMSSEEAVQQENLRCRPKTPDFKRFVYGFVGLWESDELSVHGTACAITEKLVFTAYHSIKDNALQNCALVRELRGARQVLKTDVIQLDLIAFNEDEDWALLSRKSGSFADFCNTLCSESQLPTVGSYVAVWDFPVGLIAATADGSRSDSLFTSAYQYEQPYKPVDMANKNCWKIVDQVTEPRVVERVITVKGGRSIRSCGAPYFSLRGEIIGFHTRSVNDGGGSSSSHIRYNCGNVFCRLPRFVEEYRAQTGLTL